MAVRETMYGDPPWRRTPLGSPWRPPSSWYRTPDGWRHAPRWKRAVNGVLRAVQPQRYKWLVYTVADIKPDGSEPVAISYGFGRIDCRGGGR